LATTFPNPEVLANLLSTGEAIAIPPAQTLCVSGSSAWTGADIVIGDLDYCQYVELAPAAVVAAAAAFRTASDVRILLKATYGRKDAAVPPWSASWANLAAAMGAQSIDNAQRFMIEFLGKCEPFGPLPLSNVILSSDSSARQRGAAHMSHVYQEATAVRPPAASALWSLVDPEQLRDYLVFLKKHADEYAESRPIKAVKRGLSIAHTIRLDSYVSEALGILLSADAAVYTAAKRREELTATLQRCDEETRQWFSQYVGEMADNDASATLPGDVAERCRDFVTRLLAEIERMESDEPNTGAAI
jgi:hypothetical protein